MHKLMSCEENAAVNRTIWVYSLLNYESNFLSCHLITYEQNCQKPIRAIRYGTNISKRRQSIKIFMGNETVPIHRELSHLPDGEFEVHLAKHENSSQVFVSLLGSRPLFRRVAMIDGQFADRRTHQRRRRWRVNERPHPDSSPLSTSLDRSICSPIFHIFSLVAGYLPLLPPGIVWSTFQFLPLTSSFLASEEQ